MGTFQNKTFRSSADAGKIGMKYRGLMAKHPFLAFGLPFIAVIVAGSFVLTPATAIRYEKHDRRVRQMTKEEELKVRRGARKVDMKEEYYGSFGFSICLSLLFFLGVRGWRFSLFFFFSCLALHNGLVYLSVNSCKGEKEGERHVIKGAEKIRYAGREGGETVYTKKKREKRKHPRFERLEANAE
jgi:cytochrome c oxidase assembly protein subunit 16